MAQCIKNRRETCWLWVWGGCAVWGFFHFRKGTLQAGGTKWAIWTCWNTYSDSNRVNTNRSLEPEVKLVKPSTVTIFLHVWKESKEKLKPRSPSSVKATSFGKKKSNPKNKRQKKGCHQLENLTAWKTICLQVKQHRQILYNRYKCFDKTQVYSCLSLNSNY